jgi:hypothetical protein
VYGRIRASDGNSAVDVIVGYGGIKVTSLSVTEPMSEELPDSQIVQIEEWGNFVELVQQEPAKHYAAWRGVKNHNYHLASSFQRNVLSRISIEKRKPEIVNKLRDRLFRYFSTAIRGLRGSNPAELDDYQLWALGRHYGLDTPYLDWSNSPFLATFFAVFDLFNDYIHQRVIQPESAIFGYKDGEHQQVAKFSVYQLELSKDLFPDIDYQNTQSNAYPYIKQTKNRVRRYVKSTNEDWLLFLDINVEELRRMQGQRGHFTMMGSSKHLTIESLLNANKDIHCLKKYIISDRCLRDALQHLLLHGIDYKLIYPDLEGAAKHANLLSFVKMFHESESSSETLNWNCPEE